MITQKIQSKNNQSVLHRVWPNFTLLNNTNLPIKQTFPQGNRVDNMPWDKVRFNIWIADILDKYPLNSLVTLKQIPCVPHIIPFYFRITYVEELANHVIWDRDVQEPAVLHMVTTQGKPVNKCPSVVRPLTDEEMTLVHLQNSKPKGTA
jgi:hypothetical protein